MTLVELEPIPKPSPKNLPSEVVRRNMELADMAPDSTRDAGHRPETWNPPPISREEHDLEHPYAK